MKNSNESNQHVKMVKSGNSYVFRISEKDLDFLNADENTKFKKIISRDGSKITFKKIEKL